MVRGWRLRRHAVIGGSILGHRGACNRARRARPGHVRFLFGRIEVHDLLPPTREGIGEDEHQVAGPSHAQGGFHGLLLIDDQCNAVIRNAVGAEGIREHHRHFVHPSPARAVIATADIGIEVRGGRHGANGMDVLVAAIAWRGEHADAPALHAHPVHELAHGAHRVGIVAVVIQHAEWMFVVHVQPARCLKERGVEGAQAVADVLEPHAHGEGHGRREHRVLYVERCTPLERGGNEVRPQQRDVRAVIVDGDHVAIHAGLDGARPATGTDVLPHDVVRRIHRHVADVPGLGIRGHAQRERIVGVQHCGIRRYLHDGALHFGELLQRLDPLLPEVIGLDVQHGAHVHVPHRHPRAQQTATSGLENSHLHRRIAQHDARGGRARHVALHGALAIDVDAIRGGEPHALACQLVDVREQPRGRRLAVRAGDRGNRHRARRILGKEHVDDLARCIARSPLTRRRVHAESRCRIHLADCTADVLVRLRDVWRQEVHAANVQANRLDGANGHFCVVRMHHVRHVRGSPARGQVGREAEIDVDTGSRNGRRRQTTFRQQRERLMIELDLRQHLLVPDPPARIGIHRGHQFRNGVHAVARHLARLALRYRNELAIHHQHAVVMPHDEAFNDHAARVLLRLGEPRGDLVRIGERDGHTTPMISVVRLGDHGKSHPLGGRHCALGSLDQLLLRHRQSQARKDAVGLLLVARKLHGHVRCATGYGGLDALLVAAIAQLDQTLVIETKPWDASLLGGMHDARRTRAQCTALRIANESITAGDEVKGVVEVARRS